MYAVIEFAGHQYKVKEGDKLEINSLKEKEGAKVSVDKVLMTFDDKGGAVKLGNPYTGDAVELKVLEHKKGDKVRVFKMLAKKRYRRNKGHRQSLTVVEVVKIGAAKASAKPAAEKKAPAKKTAPKKKAPAKKTEKKD
jgi:large subunit ribosomal protein L21